MKKLVNIIANIINWLFDTDAGFIVFLAVVLLTFNFIFEIYWDNLYNR